MDSLFTPAVVTSKTSAPEKYIPVFDVPTVLVIIGADTLPPPNVTTPVTPRVLERVVAPLIVVAGVMVTAPVETLPMPMVPVPLALTVKPMLVSLPRAAKPVAAPVAAPKTSM
jgi:hypothetical protein